MLECGCVSPFSECGLDEAFGLAVCLRGIRLDPDVLYAELLAGAFEVFGDIAASIVGHDALDRDAEAFEVGDCCDQECDGAVFCLVGENINAGDTRMVVDGDMSELPTCAAVAGAEPGYSVAGAVEAAEFFDVEMDDLAGLFALVARAGLLRLEAGKPAKAASFENARDRGFGDSEVVGDVLLGAALPAQGFDGVASGLGSLAGR